MCYGPWGVVAAGCVLIAQVSHYKIEFCLAEGGEIHVLSEVKLGSYLSDVLRIEIPQTISYENLILRSSAVSGIYSIITWAVGALGG